MMKKRLISILLVCMISLLFASSAFAIFVEPTTTLPDFGMNGYRPDHETWKGEYNPHPLKPNPLPGTSGAPIPKPGDHREAFRNELDDIIGRIAAKYGASAESLRRYMSITPHAFSKLSDKDQVALKNLMMKMAAKELGISVSKLEEELLRAEREWVREIARRTGRSESEVRSMLHRHIHHTLLHQHKHHNKYAGHHTHKHNVHKHGHKHTHGHKNTYKHTHRNTRRHTDRHARRHARRR